MGLSLENWSGGPIFLEKLVFRKFFLKKMVPGPIFSENNGLPDQFSLKKMTHPDQYSMEKWSIAGPKFRDRAMAPSFYGLTLMPGGVCYSLVIKYYPAFIHFFQIGLH